MWTLVRRRASAPVAEPAASKPELDPQALVGQLSRQASALGRDAAEVRGAIDDAHRNASLQAAGVRELAQQLQLVLQGQQTIDDEAARSLGAARGARQALQSLGGEVAGIVETLHHVAEAAGQITQIALQTRLVAFNASVEAKRAGDAGRGFGVVADAVKDLAARVEASSKDIMGTVARLETRVEGLSRETRVDPQNSASQGQVHQALAQVEQVVARIGQATEQGRSHCACLSDSLGSVESSLQRTASTLDAALGRTETFLQVSEHMIEAVAGCGIETEDTIYIHAAQAAAHQIGRLLDDALRTATITETDLFDERYQPVAGSDPQQHLTRFVELAERLFPQVQEKLLGLSDKVVFGIAADRNGYIACHNAKYNHPQRPGDALWNAANCRNRRIFGDRTGLASARSTKPFLLQTYRRDMGGGRFVVMKEAAAPIEVGGRHWGGLRLGFLF